MCTEVDQCFENTSGEMKEAKQRKALKGMAAGGRKEKGEKMSLKLNEKNGSADIVARSENQLSDHTVLQRFCGKKELSGNLLLGGKSSTTFKRI
ncbi:hypothetical protein Pmani_037813 [Petrolisthes manimaculis]|uniref:Uncharacterized protein n=1 Tax=Petrolisthes manimaculis TaxID=1843537 RepID=A0AAE1TMY1_9EUCA|nr:hypothetical protein Pmani_037813 [Petrolisthes manimaculis]